MTSPRSLVLSDAADATGDPLVRAARDAIGATHTILGELGRGPRIELALLVQSRDRGHLGVAALQPASGGEHMELMLLDYIDATIPATAIPCPVCQTPLRVWGRFCTRCGVDLAGLTAADAGLSDDQMLAYIQEHADGYQVLGAVPRRGDAGAVYFARDLQSGALVALRLETQPGTGRLDKRHSVEVTGQLSAVSATPAHVGSSGRGADWMDWPVGGSHPAELLRTARAQAAGQFDVFGMIGQNNTTPYFLGRDLASAALVVLRLVQSTGGFQLNIRRRLEDDMTPRVHICAACGAMVSPVADRCQRCSRALSSGRRSSQEQDMADARFRALSEATNGDYEFIGGIESAGPEAVAYFARRVADEAIVGIRCERLEP